MFVRGYSSEIERMDTHKNIESALIRQFQTGDVNAFASIYQTYYKGLCAYAAQYVPVADCEEIVQDSMMWLWENRCTLLPDMPLKGLLFTIVKNKSLNAASHIQVKNRVHNLLYSKLEKTFDDPDFYLYNELVEIFNKAVDGLPEEYRKAFILNRFENMTYSEIALMENVSPKTIAYRISQALRILRKDLADYLPLFAFLLFPVN